MRGQKGCSGSGERLGVLGPGRDPWASSCLESRGPACCGPHSPCHALLRGWRRDLEGLNRPGPPPSTLPSITDPSRRQRA